MDWNPLSLWSNNSTISLASHRGRKIAQHPWNPNKSDWPMPCVEDKPAGQALLWQLSGEQNPLPTGYRGKTASKGYEPTKYGYIIGSIHVHIYIYIYVYIHPKYGDMVNFQWEFLSNWYFGGFLGPLRNSHCRLLWARHGDFQLAIVTNYQRVVPSIFLSQNSNIDGFRIFWCLWKWMVYHIPVK